MLTRSTVRDRPRWKMLAFLVLLLRCWFCSAHSPVCSHGHRPVRVGGLLASLPACQPERWSFHLDTRMDRRTTSHRNLNNRQPKGSDKCRLEQITGRHELRDDDSCLWMIRILRICVCVCVRVCVCDCCSGSGVSMSSEIVVPLVVVTSEYMMNDE